MLLIQMDHEKATSSSPLWARLSYDLTELILSYLPLTSLVRASAVCKHWLFLLSDPSFPKTRTRKPWFFIYGQNNIFLKQNQGFGYDPESHSWIRIPSSLLTHTCFSGAAGFLFSTTDYPTRFSYSPLLLSSSGSHRQTPPLSFPRLNPLVGVFNDKIIVVGGSRFIGGLVDIEDRLAVEIYDPVADCWELCAPLPSQFGSNNSSQWLCSALLFNRFFFVFGIFSNTLSAFDLIQKKWTAVKTLRPPGVLFSFLVACKDRLILAGLCTASFTLWEVDYATAEYREIGAMPKDLMACLFDSDDEDAKFASLKCVGTDGMVYVFNEDHREGYPACVCEIGDDDLVCNWRKLPPLPGPVNRFHKVIAFCSDVPLHSVLAAPLL